MASIFQPDISDPTIPRDFSRPTQTRLPDFVGPIKAIAGASLARKQAKAETENTKFLGELAGDVTAVQAERRKQALLGQDIQANSANILSLVDDGEISEEDGNLLTEFNSQVNRFNQARRSGALNDNAFNLRMDALRATALERAPHLTDDIREISGKGTEKAPPVENAAQRAVAQKLDNTYGPGNWDGITMAREFAKIQRIANSKQDVESGDLSALQRAAAVNTAVQDALSDSLTTVSQEVQNNTFASPATIDNYKQTVEQVFMQAQDSINKGYKAAAARGELISTEVRDRDRKELAAQKAARLALIDDKDYVTQATRMLALRESMIKANFPATNLDQIIGGGGAEGKISALEAVLDPNSPLSKMMQVGDPTGLGSEIVAQHRAATMLIVSGGDVQDPRMKKWDLANRAMMMTKNPPPPAQEKYMDVLIQKGAETRADIDDSIRQLSNPRIANNVDLSVPETRRKFQQTVTHFSDRIVRGMLEAAQETNQEIRLTPEGRVAGVTRSQGGGDFAFETTIPATSVRFTREWNNLLDMAELPQYSAAVDMTKVIADARKMITDAQTPAPAAEQGVSDLVQELLNDPELKAAGVTEAEILEELNSG